MDKTQTFPSGTVVYDTNPDIKIMHRTKSSLTTASNHPLISPETLQR